ncbi:tetratricopeptide repeat protein [Azospirillum sp. sgz301742]
MFDRKLAALAVIAGMAVSGAIACGPDFPWQLLDRREETLKAAPANSFAFEAARLVPAPDDGLKPVEGDDADSARKRADAEEPTPAARLYTAGAVAFQAKDLAAATARFEEVLGLPEPDRPRRAVWAAFMLGRIAAEGENWEKAEQAFALTRTLARAGAPDPLGLAVASLGEQGRLHLIRAERLVSEDGVLASADEDAYASAMDAAVTLYAEQAARGSRNGLDSLRVVARRLTAVPPLLAAAFPRALPQRLIVAYAQARTEGAEGMLADIVAALDQHGIDRVTGADRLASLAYGQARYDLAGRLADKAPGPLAAWVKAKLALQRGDRTGAAGFLAEAARAFPTEGAAALDPDNATRVRGEAGTLALARGEYVHALELLYPLALTYWGDVVHIAERVLTTDELKVFVDSRGKDAPAPSADGTSEQPWTTLSGYLTKHQLSLGDVLARRLMRDGRHGEALGYYSDPRVAGLAADYVQVLRAAQDGWWSIDRARAWHQAAVLARREGMEIMGTEAAPDYAVYSGSFDVGLGQRTLDGQPYVSDGERQRFDASRARPDERYHYRYLAVAHAEAAADLLPPRSQAFAAVLCQATGWMYSTARDDRAQALYARYVKDGPLVEWAEHFGRDCPEPDFDSAAQRQLAYHWMDARDWAHGHRWPLAAAAVLFFAGVAGLWAIRRRRGAPA